MPSINDDLYEQAVQHNPHLANNFYCWNIPSDAFINFLELYRKRPIRKNLHGVRAQAAFFLWYLIKQIDPTLVVESGVLKGQSTWIIEQAAPQAKIFAIDPCFKHLIYKSPKAVYTSDDFSTLSIDPKERAVCFFDDHQNSFERVLQAHSKGIKHLIFDDNCPPGYDDRIDPHLTLRACFEMKQHEDKAEILKKIIRQYSITPQIIGKKAAHFRHIEVEPLLWGRLFGNWPSFWEGLETVDQEAANNLPSIWQCLEDAPSIRSMKIFSDDAVWYRWMTYVELF